MNLLPFLIIAGIALAVLSIVVLSARTTRKRTERMQAAAKALGLPFSAEGDPQWIQHLSQFHLFSQGRAKRIRNMIHGKTEELELSIFDYQYTTGSGKHAHTSIQSVICFQSPLLQLPDFVMRPESVFDRIGGVFGYRDFDFDTHPAFSRTFVLRGNDEQRIRSVFAPEVLEHFEGHTGVCVEASGPRLIYYRSGRKTAPEQASSFLEEGFAVFALLRGSAG